MSHSPSLSKSHLPTNFDWGVISSTEERLENWTFVSVVIPTAGVTTIIPYGALLTGSESACAINLFVSKSEVE